MKENEKSSFSLPLAVDVETIFDLIMAVKGRAIEKAKTKGVVSEYFFRNKKVINIHSQYTIGPNQIRITINF